MSETNLVLLFTEPLNQLGFTYIITGSVAGVVYGEPRVTHDVDLVLAISERTQAAALCRAFPIDAFYCPPEDIVYQEMLRAQRGHFNLIHHQTGFKADIYIANRDPLHQWALTERRIVSLDEAEVSVAPPEYVIVRKLEYFREGGSEKHLRDIEAMLRVSAADIRRRVLEQWIQVLGVQEQWARVQGTS